MDTLKQVMEDVSPFVGDSGTCPEDSEVIIKAINDARRILWPLGNWKGLTSDIVIQSYGGSITLPNAYDNIVKARHPVRPMVIENEWFVIVTGGFKDCSGMCRPIKVNEPVIAFRDFTVEFPHDCFYRLEALWESNHDQEQEITIHGYNKVGGRESIVRKYHAAFQSETADPIRDVFMRNLYAVEKPKTDGRIRLYAFIPDVSKRVLISIFEKDDINPSLVRYKIGSCRTRAQYLVQAKKRYRPLVNESDFVDIHTDALIHVLQGITARKNRNNTEFNNSVALAVQYLNRELASDESFEPGFIKFSGADNVTNLNGGYCGSIPDYFG